MKGYEVLESLTSNGITYAPGTSLPMSEADGLNIEHLQSHGCLGKLKEMTSKQAQVFDDVAREAEENAPEPLLDIQALNIPDAKEAIDGIRDMRELYLLQEQEKSGKKRPSIYGALNRQIKSLT